MDCVTATFGDGDTLGPDPADRNCFVRLTANDVTEFELALPQGELPGRDACEPI